MIFVLFRLFLTFYVLSQPLLAVARRHGFKHEAMNALRARQTETIALTQQCPAPSAKQILSTVTPSPDAQPVEITAQSQVVTSYTPDMTWCVGPPIGLVPVATLTGPPYTNDSTLFSATTAGTGRCETVYVPTATTVCAMTLNGLASRVTVSECDQQITFSSECGFTLVTPSPVTSDSGTITPAPTIKSMMTYWLAPWQSLTMGETPSEVDVKICKIQGDDTMECIRYQEVWEVVVMTQTITTQREVQVTTTLSGPGTLILETMHAYINDTVACVDLSTKWLLETEVETESISKSKKLVTRPEIAPGPASTKYVTKVVKYKSTSARPEPTTVVHLTSTITQHVGTVTRTRGIPKLPPRPSLMERPEPIP